MCNNCEKAKTIKNYYYIFQEGAKKVYQFIYTDFIGLITLIRFEVERYFFTFTNDHTYITKMDIEKQKSIWLKSLKTFYNLVHIHTGLKQLIEKL